MLPFQKEKCQNIGYQDDFGVKSNYVPKELKVAMKKFWALNRIILQRNLKLQWKSLSLKTRNIVEAFDW